MVAGCGNDENAGGGPTKQDYEDAAKEMADGIGLISLYVPYLDAPKAEGKYDPRPTARDVQPRKERAADAIRLAAHEMRQRGKSKVTKALGDALASVSRACTRAEGDEAIKKCKDAVNALDVELEKQAKAGSEAGATAKIPRIGPEAATETAKKKFEPFRKALGPTPKEVETLTALNDAKANIDKMIADCDAAAEEQKAVEKTYEGVDEELRKLAVKHRFAIEAICRIVKRIEASKAELKPCEEIDKERDEKKWGEAQCPLACSKAEGYIKEPGIPSAAQEDFDGYYKKVCIEEKK